MGFTNFYLGHGAPSDWGEDKRTVSKSSQRALCRTRATSPRIHFSLLFLLLFFIWSFLRSYLCPLVCESCKNNNINNWSPLSLFFSTSAPHHHYISHPLPASPQSILPPTPHPPPLSGPSPGFHPSHPATTGVYVSVKEFVWDQSFYFFPPPLLLLLFALRGLTASQRGQWRHCQQPGHEKCIA